MIILADSFAAGILLTARRLPGKHKLSSVSMVIHG